MPGSSRNKFVWLAALLGAAWCSGALAQSGKLFEGSISEARLWVRPGPGCTGAGGSPATFVAQEIRVDDGAGGVYELEASFTGIDGFLFVYADEFDRRKPAANCLAAFASSGDGAQPAGGTVTLDDNRSYVLVASSLDGTTNGDFEVSYDGTFLLRPGNIDPSFDELAGRDWRFEFTGSLFGDVPPTTVRFSAPFTGDDGFQRLRILDAVGDAVGLVQFSPFLGHFITIQAPNASLATGSSELFTLITGPTGYISPSEFEGNYRRSPAARRKGAQAIAVYFPLDMVRGGLVADSTADFFGSVDGAFGFQNAPPAAGASFFPSTGLRFEPGDQVDFGNAIAIPGLADFSISLWLRVEPDTEGTVVAQGGSRAGGFELRVIGDEVAVGGLFGAIFDGPPEGALAFTVFDADTGEPQFSNDALYGVEPIDDGEWHHVVIGREAGSGVLYVDGEVQRRQQSSALAALDGTFPVTLGQAAASLANPGVAFAGDIAELRIIDSFVGDDQVGCLLETNALCQSSDLSLFGFGSDLGIAFNLGGTGAQTFDANSLNGRPDAVDDSFTAVRGETLIVDVIVNDGDPDGDELTVSARAPTAAIPGIVLAADGELSLAPTTATPDEVSFVYEATDGLSVDRALVTITVEDSGTGTPPDPEPDPDVVTGFYAYLCAAFGLRCDP